MESIQVTLTDAGQLQLTVDGVSYPPLSVEAVEALAAQLPAAKTAMTRREVVARMRTLIRSLAPSGEDLSAEIVVTATSIVAEIDDESFDRACRLLELVPDPQTGELVLGGTVIRRKP